MRDVIQYFSFSDLLHSVWYSLGPSVAANGIISFFFISQTCFTSQFSSGRGPQERLSLQDSLPERELVMGTEWAAGESLCLGWKGTETQTTNEEGIQELGSQPSSPRSEERARLKTFCETFLLDLLITRACKGGRLSISIQKQTSTLLACLGMFISLFSLTIKKEWRGKDKINSKSTVNVIESGRRIEFKLFCIMNVSSQCLKKTSHSLSETGKHTVGR